MYKFDGTIKSAVNCGRIEFRIEPTSPYAIKSPNGKVNYVAFDEKENAAIIPDRNLKFSLDAPNVNHVLASWLCAYASSGQSVQFEFDKVSNILKDLMSQPKEPQ